MNIIADIAGQYNALMRLIDKMPGGPIVLLGDMIDRGPKSKEIIDWLIANPEVKALMGNHEHMMLDFCLKTKIYERGIWLGNGGGETQKSYGMKPTKHPGYGATKIPQEHIDYLKTLPWYIETEADGVKLFLSHAPLWANHTLSCATKTDEHLFDTSLLWNRRREVADIEDTLSLFGHNAHWGLSHFKRKDGTTYAICLDGSRQDVLTGFSTKTMQIYQEPYNIDTTDK